MAESKLLLGYWNIRGLGQPIRNLMQYLQIPYNEKRYSDGATWFQIDKPLLKTDFPNLPFIEDGDQVITESEAILNYLAFKAQRSDLLGVTAEEKVHLAQLKGVLQDIKKVFYEIVANKTLKDLKTEFHEKVLPKLTTFSKHMGNDEFLIGKLSVLDFIFAEFIGIILLQESDWLSSLPNLKTYYERVNGLKGLKEYNASGEGPLVYQGVGMMNPLFKIQKLIN